MTTYGHPLRFGVHLTPEPEHPLAAVELASAAEDLGYDLAVIGEHDDRGSDAVSLAAWAVARTKRITVVPQIDAAVRPSSVLVRSVASLRALSQARVEVALSPGADPENVLDRETPLWVSGGDAAAAEVAGRMADGWLASSTDLTHADLTALSDTVDTAARAAGRDVREIRRGVVITPDTPADALVDLALTQGTSTFVVDVADAAAAQEFMEHVVPAVRREVTAALPADALASRPLRRADVRAQRSPGIAYDDLPEDIRDTAVEPGDPAFATVRSTYMRGGSPGLVLRPRTVSEVASAIEVAHQHRHLPLGIRSGGHGISGRSTNHGGLVIDVGALDEITILDESKRLVRIGPGARWRDVAKALQPYGWSLSSGDYGGVGVGGIATSGGIGFLNRAHGLTIDHLRAAELVLADGTFVRTSATENPELFWALRGAGGNFGVATAFEFEVDAVDQVGWAQLAFRVDDAAAYLQNFGRVVTNLPRETTPFLILGQGMARVMAMVDSTEPEVIVSQLQPLADIAPLVDQQVVIAPYAAVMNMFPEAPHDGRGEPVSRSALVWEITPEFAAASADLIRSGASHWYQIRSVGGAVADVPADETAYAHRDARFSLTVMGANAQRLDRWFDPVRAHSDGLYLSFETDLDPQRIHDAFPPGTLRRLQELKAQLDPTNLFADNFNVSPTPASSTARSES